MEIVEATEADVPAVCELLGVLFDQEEEFVADPEKQARGVHAILASPEVGRILVLKEGETVIGLVNLLFHPSTALGGTVAILEDFVVRPEHRGKGAGSQLLAAAIAYARDRGCLRVTLVTDGVNAGAQRLYERHGFQRSEMVTMRWLGEE